MDPISRLQQQEIDRVFGAGHAQRCPELVAAVMQSAASNYAVLAVARGLRDIAAALADEDEAAPQNGPGIVRARGLVRPSCRLEDRAL